jgi:hypothetical protein
MREDSIIFCTTPTAPAPGIITVRTRSACWSCGVAASPRCGGCMLACYCNLTCQLADRTRHKHACKAITTSIVAAKVAGGARTTYENM